MRIALGILALAGLPALAQATTFDLFVVNFAFTDNVQSPFSVDLTINPGDTVRWSWINSGHSVTSVAGIAESFNSGIRSSGAVFSHTFTNTGAFAYYCQPHGADNGDGTALGMSANVVVVPAPAAGLAMAMGALAFRRRRR